jgi:hypothetical protein
VVKGTIARASSRFTEDRLDITTTFELDNLEILLGTIVSHAHRPEVLLPSAFVQRGGNWSTMEWCRMNRLTVEGPLGHCQRP